jgi:mono/diheme cytochrome c family protein
MVLKSSFLLSFVLILFAACDATNSTNADFTESTDNRTQLSGKELFGLHCSSCHGMDGKLGNSGAKDLTLSQMTDEEILLIIHEGRKAMPPMAELIGNQSDLDSVLVFVKALRN